MNNPGSSTETVFQVSAPRNFKLSALLAINAYGVLLVLPVVFAVLAVTVIRLSALTFLLPLATVVFVTFFLPFGFGNAYVSRLVRRSGTPPGEKGYIVQLTTNPRMYSGARAVLEDADDVGWLSITDSSLRFEGDCVRLSLPIADIDDLRLRNIGFRGFFLSASRVSIRSRKLRGLNSIEFSERFSMILPLSRRITRDIWNDLREQQWPGRPPA